jgi:hypothetical protein
MLVSPNEQVAGIEPVAAYRLGREPLRVVKSIKERLDLKVVLMQDHFSPLD